MNNVILCGRLTQDPQVFANNDKKSARYTLAVERGGKKVEGQPTADFINCVVFGQSADFAEKYLKKGTKLIVNGEIRTGSYQNKDGQKVYTTDVFVGKQEFAESKRADDNTAPAASEEDDEDEVPFV